MWRFPIFKLNIYGKEGSESMNNETKECKYPMQCASIVRKQTLGVEAKLSRTDIRVGEAPLEMYNSFSRFPIVLISNDKKAATGNIPIDDMEQLLVRSEFAMSKQMERELNPVSASSREQLSPAYTVKMLAGDMKGKTPAEVLLSNPEDLETNKNKLNNHYKWLQENVSKFPNNQSIMNAIADASKLLQTGQLKATSVNSGTFVLLDPGMRPLIRKTDKKGNCFVYEIKITWIFDNNYPVQVEVTNYYAPVTKDPQKGLLNVQKKQMDRSTLIQNKMSLSVKEWNKVIRGIKRSMSIFESMNGAVAWKEAIDLDRANREKYANQQTPADYQQDGQGYSARVTPFPQQAVKAQSVTQVQQTASADPKFYDFNSFNTEGLAFN